MTPAITHPTMTEDDLQTAIISAAHVYGYRVAHFRPALTTKGWRTPVSADGKGFFDLVLAKPHRLIVVECKSEKGKLSPEQEAWRDAVWGACEAYTWRPIDWIDGTVLRILSMTERSSILGGSDG